jgi:hypothetical protein
MKAIRRTALAIMISTLALSSTIFAATPQTVSKKIEKAEQGFLYAMSSEQTGVVENCIFISMELKCRYPEFEFKKVQAKLNLLAGAGETPVIRYRAQLASLYYSNYSLFADIKIEDKDNPEKTFRAIIDRIENNRVASN